MRTACEKGFNVITLTDCCATTSEDGQKAATGGTFGMFSQPVSAEEAKALLPPGTDAPKADVKAAPSKFDELWPAYEAKMRKEGLNEAAIAAFRYNFGVLTSGADLMIPEASVETM